MLHSASLRGDDVELHLRGRQQFAGHHDPGKHADLR
jgi:hypothetical protein